jgi:acyl-CoA synthetase (AMP-forming)/AMP-acid ligase II
MNVAADLDSVPDLLRGRARLEPSRPFARLKERAFSYGEFDARTDELAAGLAELGVRPGDVVSVFLPNCLEFLEAWWAILKAGGVFGPVNPAYTSPEAGYVIGHSEAVAVVTDARGAAVIAPWARGARRPAHSDLDRRGRRSRVGRARGARERDPLAGPAAR